MSQKPILPDDSPIEPVNLRDALEERYLAYALSTIMGRALPDVRDGLKPVHRRILYAMRELKLDPDSGYKKCAKIVGEVMGNYHPHGDQAIYDALVRLAQDFAVRYPMVDGQGNFGNIDGDNAAAMRYTESRLTETATLLLDGIDDDTVDFRPTYDGTNNEPVVLPAAFPNLLANGSSGIAVGMATNIPPHNAEELCNALLHLIKHPNATIEKLVEYIPGPDFPTGGVIVEPREQILEAYRTGRGGFRLRAKWEREDLGRGGYQIVITEVPYQVQKSKLVERIAELMSERKLPLLGDVRDESAEEIRLVLEPKTRTVDHILLMESLFKLTELEIRFGLNMNVLSGGQIPNVLSLRDVLWQWLEHRIEVLVRRSNHRLQKIEHRLEVLAGYLIAFLNIDEVIRIVRFEDQPKAKLIETFELTDVQAEAILNLRLRALSKLEEIQIRAEHDKLSAERDSLKALLASEDLQWTKVAEEIKETRERYSKKTDLGRRRSSFAETPTIEVDLDQAFVEKEPVTVILSEKGWVRTLKGHVDDLSKLDFKQGDKLKRAFHAHTTDKILMFATNGKFFTLEASQLPGGRGHGEPVRLMVDFEDNHDIVTAFVYQPGRRLLVASTAGYGFIVPEDEVVAATRKGKQVLNVSEPDEAKLVVPVEGDRIATVGDNRRLLIFETQEVNEMTRGKGVILQRFRDGGLSDVKAFDAETGLTWVDSANRTFTMSLDDLADWVGARAQAGRTVPPRFPRSNSFGPAFG
ncbi:DNA topoisomerase 4 subunit A [Candidatus Filomicrobium marinum]|uniref:DNA topoisomerase 4 subunit A n=1 Tax=Candidatus Filomicrobium marinum TaxID=1608628 RepID=A0A0D6JIE3_9HYPH|nr:MULTISPECIES: DNA topoisomerase IV subunit A [Filomicrobium]MCV0369484.1 DNA topoisomerase IV subunit A [Filomicrobium sp.]CFX43763.1 DNA topoisomerase 4 subunit A [Candidatus Filomicrobium marinum]CPR20945.1 DNA topoisomerase 4 subunit A [Candidatus Filomicrobium marinum]